MGTMCADLFIVKLFIGGIYVRTLKIQFGCQGVYTNKVFIKKEFSTLLMFPNNI